ncbi:transposase IS4 family protein [Deinococcus phoenicis]|uniref:Transposase IS4 family protein n=1 Tax=Deinococcus phoenicis TaxID=1476583 RepID=A0A016QKB2_9DEIO|nr:transposase [Deinococcus phoenicis]EYB66426.1 transposase IS4 family protein [Deinococcus phoenicis]
MYDLKLRGERASILADALLSVPTSPYQQRSLEAALGLFLDLKTKKALHRAYTVSASALSRLLNVYEWDTAECWTTLVQAQWDALLLAARRKHHPRLRLCVDLTSVPKTGRDLPFVRVYNEVYGIHLVVLYAVYGDLKFPVGYRVYRGKGTPSPVRLALELLATVPAEVSHRFDVWVLADSGFESANFLQGVRDLGFEFVVGVRSTRRTDHPGHVTVEDCAHGSWIHLANWPWETLTLARVERGERTFFSVASQLLPGDQVAREGGRRWAIESFFKEAKHGFGLNRFALRTAQGLDRWVLLVFAAFTLAMLCRADTRSLEQAAEVAARVALPLLVVQRLAAQLWEEEEFLRQHGYSFTLSRCKT